MALFSFAFSPTIRPPRSGGFSGNLCTAFWGQLSCSHRTALEATLSGVLFALRCRSIFLSLPRRDPHNVDGVADHVGGALLAFGASGHGQTFPSGPIMP